MSLTFSFEGLVRDKEGPSKQIRITITLRRIFVYHLATTFLPTICLIMIAELTLYIDVVHFEATIMVALTTMLVMYTLYQSVASSLPQTSYLKMVDLWLLVGLILPFFVLIVLILADSTNKCLEISPTTTTMTGIDIVSGDMYITPKKKVVPKILRVAQITFPIATLAFTLIFWIVCLSHYYQNY
jgi:hypothetical protein